MKASIIIPVFNAEKHLPQCLDSILFQSYQEFEVICINDCSTDKSLSILKQYQSKYPDKFTIINNTSNIGAGQSREIGISISNGDYLVFVDSDDYLSQDYLETYIDEIKMDPVDIVIGGFTKDVDGKLIKHTVSDSVWSVVTYPMACAKIWNRDFIQQHDIHFGNTTCAEDTLFSLSAFLNNATFKVIPYEGYHYRLNTQSSTKSTDYTRNHEQMISSVYTSLLQSKIFQQASSTQKLIIEYSYIANMVDSLVNYNRGCGTKLMKQKYSFVITQLNKYFPNYKKNPYVGFFKPQGQTKIIRLGVGGFTLLQKTKLAKPFFYIVSLI